MLNDSFGKTERNTWDLYHVFLKVIPKCTKHVQVEITSFVRSNSNLLRKLVSHADLKFLSVGNWVLMRTIGELTLITWPRLKHTKGLNNRLPDHLLFYRVWNIRLLFTRLWTFYTDFVLIQANTSSYTPIFNYILASLHRMGLISTIYNKYSKSFIDFHFTVL